jgi:hypothetical protein
VLANIDHGLIAKWNLDGDATDATGKHPGVIHGATPSADRLGNPTGAMAFDGNDYISVTDDEEFTLGTGDFTVATWVTRSAFGADGGCYLMGHSNGPGSTNKWIMWLGSDKVSFVSTEIGWKTVGNYDFAIDDWNHVGLRLQEDTLTAFVDGLPIGSTSVPESFSIPDASRPLTIGTCEFDRPHRYLQGSLDELRFYDRALSNSEMQALVPEPSTFAIGTLFLSGLALRRRSH